MPLPCGLSPAYWDCASNQTSSANLCWWYRNGDIPAVTWRPCDHGDVPKFHGSFIPFKVTGQKNSMVGGARSARSELEKTPGTGEKLTFWTPLIEGTTGLLGMTEASSLVVRGSSSSMINAHWLFRLTSEFSEILKWQPHTFVSGYVFSLCYATIQPPRLLLQWNCSE